VLRRFVCVTEATRYAEAVQATPAWRRSGSAAGLTRRMDAIRVRMMYGHSASSRALAPGQIGLLNDDRVGRALDQLTPMLRELPWAIDANMRTEADDLRAWVACAFRDPLQPTPYLFFFGPKNSGKSFDGLCAHAGALRVSGFSALVGVQWNVVGPILPGEGAVIYNDDGCGNRPALEDHQWTTCSPSPASFWIH